MSEPTPSLDPELWQELFSQANRLADLDDQPEAEVRAWLATFDASTRSAMALLIRAKREELSEQIQLEAMVRRPFPSHLQVSRPEDDRPRSMERARDGLDRTLTLLNELT